MSQASAEHFKTQNGESSYCEMSNLGWINAVQGTKNGNINGSQVNVYDTSNGLGFQIAETGLSGGDNSNNSVTLNPTSLTINDNQNIATMTRENVSLVGDQKSNVYLEYTEGGDILYTTKLDNNSLIFSAPSVLSDNLQIKGWSVENGNPVISMINGDNNTTNTSTMTAVSFSITDGVKSSAIDNSSFVIQDASGNQTDYRLNNITMTDTVNQSFITQSGLTFRDNTNSISTSCSTSYFKVQNEVSGEYAMFEPNSRILSDNTHGTTEIIGGTNIMSDPSGNYIQITPLGINFLDANNGGAGYAMNVTNLNAIFNALIDLYAAVNVPLPDYLSP